MEEALQRFAEWLIRFVVISAVVLLVTHLIARSLRSKKKQKLKTDEDKTEE